MNKLLIQNLNDKFINNLAYCELDSCSVIATNTKGILYRAYSEHHFTHIVFIDSLLDIESLQFIEDFASAIQIFIYIDGDSENYKLIKQKIALLSVSKIENTSHKIIKIPTLVNPNLYHALSSNNKQDHIVSFIEKIQSLPEDLYDYLYPKNTLKIKLFNNKDIIHPQNLGLLSEQDKSILLQNTKYYLALNDDYVAEAWACGCEVLTIEDLSSMQPKKYKNAKFFQSYSNFLKGLISAKK